MNKNLILAMLFFIAVAVSMQGQDIPAGPKVVVKADVVNKGNLYSSIPVALRETNGATNTIQNNAGAEMRASAMKVGANTKVDNKGNLCIGCEAGYAFPCNVPLIPEDGIDGIYNNTGSEVLIKQAGLTYEVKNPVAGVTYTWSAPGFTPSSNTGTSVIFTAPAINGDYTITVMPSKDCGDADEGLTLSVKVSLPLVTILIPNARTGFIAGAHASMPTRSKSGDLLLSAVDGIPSGGDKSWGEINGYNSSTFPNNDASVFVGASAGCADGWRLPSVVELKAIVDELYVISGGSYWGPTSEQVPGFTQLQADTYWSSTLSSAVTSSVGNAWEVHANTGTASAAVTGFIMKLRCVLAL
jgi:hypothetical protein